MANPYRILGVEEATDDESIQRRYLELVRRFQPERAPDAFQRIRGAYETLMDERARLRFLFLDPSQGESIDEWIEELKCQPKDLRPGLKTIRAYLQKS